MHALGRQIDLSVGDHSSFSIRGHFAPPQEDDEILYLTYGSVSAGREKWPFNVLFFFKVEPPCDQT